MNSPYEEYKSCKEWQIVEIALAVLVKNNDITITSGRDYVVGYITKQIQESSSETDLKEVIKKFIASNHRIEETLTAVRSKYDQAEAAVPVFIDTFKKSGFNAALGIDFANVLQLLNDKRLVETYHLSDVRNLFDSLLKVQVYNLENYAEAAHFEWSVMNDSNKAKAIISEGLTKGKEKITELEQLECTINQE